MLLGVVATEQCQQTRLSDLLKRRTAWLEPYTKRAPVQGKVSGLACLHNGVDIES
jgi:hypothetical protein